MGFLWHTPYEKKHLLMYSEILAGKPHLGEVHHHIFKMRIMSRDTAASPLHVLSSSTHRYSGKGLDFKAKHGPQHSNTHNTSWSIPLGHSPDSILRCLTMSKNVYWGGKEMNLVSLDDSSHHQHGGALAFVVLHTMLAKFSSSTWSQSWFNPEMSNDAKNCLLEKRGKKIWTLFFTRQLLPQQGQFSGPCISPLALAVCAQC